MVRPDVVDFKCIIHGTSEYVRELGRRPRTPGRDEEKTLSPVWLPIACIRLQMVSIIKNAQQRQNIPYSLIASIRWIQ